MRIAIAFSLMFGTAALLAVACTNESEQGTLCNPEDNIFCRCRGGAAGTKKCLADGSSFGTCESPWGPCDEIEEPPDGGNTTTTTTGTTGGGGGTPPVGELLAPCESDAECEAAGMTCPMGYCTKPCASYEECDPGDCVLVLGSPYCVPYCTEQSDCDAYGAGSSCSWTPDALPAFDVVVCANWGTSVTPPPAGYQCEQDIQCNIGLTGAERVCQTGVCAVGCHQASDCNGQECSSASVEVLGTCGATTWNGDLCPGEPISISKAASVQRMEDTSELTPPDEADIGPDCLFAEGTAEERVYAVTAGEAGTLIVYAEPDTGYDVQIYVRSGDCATGTQLACSDHEGDATEILDVPVTAGQTVYVFVDGFDDSEGLYLLELDLQ